MNKNPFDITSFSSILSAMLSIKIIIGVICYMISMLLFFYLLSNYGLSLVIPMVTAFTYSLNLLSAYFILHERVSPLQIIGILIILIGISLVTYAGPIKLSLNK